jgi:hypothetical protein
VIVDVEGTRSIRQAEVGSVCTMLDRIKDLHDIDPERLFKAPVDAIDYVITHEPCRIAEPHHGTAFFDLLDRVMPDWERRKQRLERIMA